MVLISDQGLSVRRNTLKTTSKRCASILALWKGTVKISLMRWCLHIWKYMQKSGYRRMHAMHVKVNVIFKLLFNRHGYKAASASASWSRSIWGQSFGFDFVVSKSQSFGFLTWEKLRLRNLANPKFYVWSCCLKTFFYIFQFQIMFAFTFCLNFNKWKVIKSKTGYL